MVWVKRNLGLVIGGVVAFALMALAGVYLWQKRGEDQMVTQSLDDATARFESLLNRPVHPGNDTGINNIEVAKDELQKLRLFLNEVRTQFGTSEVPTNISNREFRALLDNTIADLQRKAETLGITLPAKDYWFTFLSQRTAVDFKNIDMLTHQLLDVRDLCEILYDAKIHDLKSIRRVPASSDENSPQDFLTDKKASTNEYAIVTPYELKFQGFSTELARVLDRLVQAKRCFVVRTVAVDQASDDRAGMDSGMTPASIGMMMRYNRYMPAPPPQPVAAARPGRPAHVLLDENKLLIELRVDVVRLKDNNAAQTAEPRQVAQQIQ